MTTFFFESVRFRQSEGSKIKPNKIVDQLNLDLPISQQLAWIIQGLIFSKMCE